MSWHFITSTTHIVNKEQQVNDGSLKGIPISVRKQAAWANQSSKVDKFRQISMVNVICHANQPNNLSKAMTYKHNYFITNQYTNYSFSFPNLIVNKFALYLI